VFPSVCICVLSLELATSYLVILVLQTHFKECIINLRKRLNTQYIGTIIMKLRTRSILQELNEIADRKDTDRLIESRAANIIDSAINLLESIRKNYPADDALDLERRFLNSIKGADSTKFKRGMKKVIESKNPKKKLDDEN
jgi:glucose-6-phosphate-specific signal transduction histidine kinase